MKLNKTHNKHRHFLKRYKNFFIEKGKIEAGFEFNKKVVTLDNEYNNLFEQLNKTHNAQVKMLTRKEKELEDAHFELKSKIEQVNDVLNQMRSFEAAGLQNAKNLEAMLHDEKVKKWTALNHDKNELVLNRIGAEKLASKIL